MTSMHLVGTAEILEKAEHLPSGASLIVPQATTDADGRFTVRNVPPGQYILHADRKGFINPDNSTVSAHHGANR